MALRRLLSLAATGALTGALLTGCSDTTEQYCGTLEDSQEELKDLADSAEDQDDDLFDDTLAVFEELRSEAPDDIVDEWDTLIFAIEGLDAALDDAGMSPGDYQLGEQPPGVTQDQITAIEQAADDLRAAPVVAAGKGVQDQARDVCGIDLTL